MTTTARRVGAAATVAVMLACIGTTVAIPIAHGKMLGLFGPDLGAAVSFSLVGSFLLVRGAAARLAVLMCAIGVGSSVTSLTIVLYNLAAEGGALHGAGLWVAWLNSLVWVPGFALLPALILLFPNGTLASAGWRWPIVATLAFGGSFEVYALLSKQSVVAGKPYDYAPNPTGVVDLGTVGDAGSSVCFFGMIACLVVSVGSLVVRRSAVVGIERAQFTSLLFGLALSVVVLVVVAVQANVLAAGPVLFVIELFAVLPIAVSLAVAVLRYRLYEIDTIISRTVTYALVVAVLIGVYVAVLAGLASLVPDRYGQLGVAAATLAVSVLAVPLTRRVRHAVDRRFNRSRFDAELLVQAFAARLRRDPAHGSDGADLLGVVSDTLQPAHAGVWMAPR